MIVHSRRRLALEALQKAARRWGCAWAIGRDEGAEAVLAACQANGFHFWRNTAGEWETGRRSYGELIFPPLTLERGLVSFRSRIVEILNAES